MSSFDSTASHLPAPTVSVIGDATLRAEPEEAVIVVTLTALQASAGAALDDVASRSRSLAALLAELRVPARDCSTSGVSVHEEFDHDQNGRRSVGHRALSTVAVRLDDLGLIGRLFTRATTELDARIDGPHWQIAQDDPIRLEAAREAAADAQRKAQAYAEGIGATLGAIIRLSEPDHNSHPRRLGGRIALARARGGSDLPIDPGEHEVTAMIEATFALVVPDVP